MVFFKHKYLTQTTVIAANAIVLASEDLCQVLRGLLHVKGDIRTAVKLFMDIFKGVAKEKRNRNICPTENDDRSRN